MIIEPLHYLREMAEYMGVRFRHDSSGNHLYGFDINRRDIECREIKVELIIKHPPVPLYLFREQFQDYVRREGVASLWGDYGDFAPFFEVTLAFDQFVKIRDDFRATLPKRIGSLYLKSGQHNYAFKVNPSSLKKYFNLKDAQDYQTMLAAVAQWYAFSFTPVEKQRRQKLSAGVSNIQPWGDRILESPVSLLEQLANEASRHAALAEISRQAQVSPDKAIELIALLGDHGA